MITLQYCSDLHLEFPENKAWLKAFPIKPVGEILLLSGDIVPFSVMHKHTDFFKYVSDHFKWTYWLPGNHEYYHSDAAKRSGTLHEKIKDNVFLVNNTSVQHDNIRLIFSTLWSSINPAHGYEIERNMSDFHVIRYNDYRFTADRFTELHKNSLEYLKAAIVQSHNCTTVVATHHVPTLLHYPAQYKGSLLNEAFAVELFPFIEGSSINYWIYGHHHANAPDFTIGKTTMLTNQLGYVQYGEHYLFNTAKTIIV